MVTDHIRDVENASSSLAYPTKKTIQKKYVTVEVKMLKMDNYTI